MFFGRNDAKAETPVLWPPHAKSWLILKDSDAGRDWGQEEKGTTEDEMAGWHHWLDGCESKWTLGVGDGQGGLACCNSWGHKESNFEKKVKLFFTELNWIEYLLGWHYWKDTKMLKKLCRKGNTHSLLVGVQIGKTTMKNSMKIPQKVLCMILLLIFHFCKFIWRTQHWFEKDTCIHILIAAVHTIVKLWNQPQCPQTDEWVKKMWYIYNNGIQLNHKK